MDHLVDKRFTKPLHPSFCFPLDHTLLGRITSDLHPLIYLYWHFQKIRDFPPLKSSYKHIPPLYLLPPQLWACAPGEDRQFCPFSGAFDRSGRLYVAESEHHRILVFDSDAKFLRSFGESGHREGQYASPLGLAFDHEDNLFIVDNNNDRVQKIDVHHNDKFLLEFGRKGKGPGEFSQPCGIAIDLEGNAIIADAENSRIQIFTRLGVWIRSFGKYGEGPGDFHDPVNVVVNTHGHILVSEQSAHRVQIFTPQGEFLGSFGSRNELYYPWGLAVGAEDRVLVVDQLNKKLGIYKDNQNVMFLYPDDLSEQRLGQPRNVAIDARNSNILVFDDIGGHILVFEGQ